MRMKIDIGFIIKGVAILGLAIFLYPSQTFAHPGRTDSSGCHTCRTNCANWGLSPGEYHCHNGGTTTQDNTATPAPVKIQTEAPSQTPEPTVTPEPTPTPTPTPAPTSTTTPTPTPSVNPIQTSPTPSPTVAGETTSASTGETIGVLAVLLGIPALIIWGIVKLIRKK